MPTAKLHAAWCSPKWYRMLCETSLIYADLSGADLSGAHLSGAFIVGTVLKGANLKSAKLDWGFSSRLEGVDFTDAKNVPPTPTDAR